jgi:hypothetical protein
VRIIEMVWVVIPAFMISAMHEPIKSLRDKVTVSAVQNLGGFKYQAQHWVN